MWSPCPLARGDRQGGQEREADVHGLHELATAFLPFHQLDGRRGEVTAHRSTFVRIAPGAPSAQVVGDTTHHARQPFSRVPDCARVAFHRLQPGALYDLVGIMPCQRPCQRAHEGCLIEQAVDLTGGCGGHDGLVTCRGGFPYENPENRT